MRDRSLDFEELRPPGEAFKQAGWPFHGSLEQSLEELMTEST
jgi:hypothetical protein